MRKKYFLILIVFFFIIFTVNSLPFNRTKINANNDLKKVEFKNEKGTYCINAKKYLRISTYDGKDQSNHPKVLYMPKGWNGYKYWMAYTPYPNYVDRYENPSILVSNDGVNWVLPLGSRNPVIPPPKDVNMGGHNSDPHLVLNYKDNSMELWYRVNKGTSKKRAGSEDFIYKVVSKDGIRWSKPKLIFYQKKGLCLSPAIIYENNLYKMWYVTYVNKVTVINYTESKDSTKWEKPREVYVKYDESCYPWHIDVTRTDKGYELLVANYYKQFENNLILSYAISKDGVNFGKTTDLLAPSKNTFAWDNGMIYRSSLVKVGSKYKIYYSAMDKKGRWHIGVTDMDKPPSDTAPVMKQI